MTNLQVLENFKNRLKGATPKRIIFDSGIEGRTLTSNGKELINYTTKIAEWIEPNTIKLNVTKYSRTTSKIQSQLKALLNNENIKIVEYNG